MWIYVPDGDNQNPWVGKLSLNESPKAPWRFELIRHAEGTDLYRESPFDRDGPVVALLDHSRPCTLIRPLIERIDPGSIGVGLFQRTLIEGSFAALLTDVALPEDDRIFETISFESDAFSTWYSPPAYKTDFDPKTRTPSVVIGDTRRDECDVASLGKVACTTGVTISSGVRSRTLPRDIRSQHGRKPPFHRSLVKNAPKIQNLAQRISKHGGLLSG